MSTWVANRQNFQPGSKINGKSRVWHDLKRQYIYIVNANVIDTIEADMWISTT